VNSTQSIRDAYQGGVNNTCLDYATCNQNPIDGYYTHITNSNDYTDGFDVGVNADPNTSPSMRTWDASIGNYVPVTSTITTQVNAAGAYYFFIRGSRKVDLSQGVGATLYPTILSVTGTLAPTTGVTKSFTSVASGTWHLVGNPQASSIDLITALNNPGTTGFAKNKFIVWDPSFGGVYGVGGQVMYVDGMMVPPTSNYPLATTIIQAGQGFMLQSNATSSTFQVLESDKSSSENGSIFGKKSGKTGAKTTVVTETDDPRVYITLVATTSGVDYIADGVGAKFDASYSNGIDGKDGKKHWNPNADGISGYNMSINRKGTDLGIESKHYPDPTKLDTLFLRMFLVSGATYKLQLNFKNVSSGGGGGGSAPNFTLVDNYLHTALRLVTSDPFGNNEISFSTISGDTTTYRNRFYVVIAWPGFGPNTGDFIPSIPINFTSPGPSGDVNGGDPDFVSSMKIVKNESKMQLFSSLSSIYPNPVHTTLYVSGSSKGDKITVTDMLGKAMIVVNGQSGKTPIDCSKLTSGAYFVKIETKNGTRTEKFIKQ
jgi:hypothetical protein